MILARIKQVFLSNAGFVVLLQGEDDERSLPIFIGAAEAQAIAIWMNKVDVPRPLTHDLLRHVLEFLECHLLRIEVCDLKDRTFYARLVLARNGTELTVDSRPSDAIALALRCEAPIYVAEKVMNEAGRLFEDDEQFTKEQAETAEKKGSGQQLDKLTPLQALQKDLDKAVAEERYEDAAKFRDEIERLENTHSEN